MGPPRAPPASSSAGRACCGAARGYAAAALRPPQHPPPRRWPAARPPRPASPRPRRRPAAPHGRVVPQATMYCWTCGVVSCTVPPVPTTSTTAGKLLSALPALAAAPERLPQVERLVPRRRSAGAAAGRWLLLPAGLVGAWLLRPTCCRRFRAARLGSLRGSPAAARAAMLARPCTVRCCILSSHTHIAAGCSTHHPGCCSPAALSRRLQSSPLLRGMRPACLLCFPHPRPAFFPAPRV